MINLPIIGEGILAVFLGVDGVIYSFIGGLYKIFMAIASARMMTNTIYEQITSKVYLLVGVIMLFALAYAFVQGIIDPDKFGKNATTGDGKKTITRVVIAVVGLAFAPTAFSLLYQLQGLIIDQNIIGNIFFAGSSENLQMGLSAQYSTTIDTSQTDQNGQTTNGQISYSGTFYPNQAITTIGGGVLAEQMWEAFFRPGHPDTLPADQILADDDVFIHRAGEVGGAIVGGVGAGLLVVAAVNEWNPVGWILSGALLVAGAGYAIYQDAKADAAQTVQDLEAAGNLKDVNLAQAYAYAASTNDFNIFQAFAGDKKERCDKKTPCKGGVLGGAISYNYFIALVAGLYVCYCFLTFSFDLAVRAMKLAIYQMLIPIPLVMHVVPKQKSALENYLKGIVSTFIEVFVRIAVVYVGVYICCHLETFFSIFTDSEADAGLTMFELVVAKAILIMGIVAFMRTAPKFISDALGLKGSIDMNLMNKLKNGGFFAGAGALGAGTSLAAKSAIAGYKQGRYMGRSKGASVLRGIGAAGRGAVAGVAMGLKNGRKAANFADMRKAQEKTVNDSLVHRKERYSKEANRHKEIASDGVGAYLKNKYVEGAKNATKSFLGMEDSYAEYQRRIHVTEKVNVLKTVRDMSDAEADGSKWEKAVVDAINSGNIDYALNIAKAHGVHGLNHITKNATTGQYEDATGAVISESDVLTAANNELKAKRAAFINAQNQIKGSKINVAIQEAEAWRKLNVNDEVLTDVYEIKPDNTAYATLEHNADSIKLNVQGIDSAGFTYQPHALRDVDGSVYGGPREGLKNTSGYQESQSSHIASDAAQQDRAATSQAQASKDDKK